MNAIKTVLVVLALALGLAHVSASGLVGIYGIVERVVLEPNEQTPERIQVWGAFAYVDGGVSEGASVSAARRGYLYFNLPATGFRLAGYADHATIRKEWADLKRVAGTGQAVGFGTWAYIGGFSSLNPEVNSYDPPYILETYPGGGSQIDLRVRPAPEPPVRPATYQTNVGMVKLADRGHHTEIVKRLREALGRSPAAQTR